MKNKYLTLQMKLTRQVNPIWYNCTNIFVTIKLIDENLPLKCCFVYPLEGSELKKNIDIL